MLVLLQIHATIPTATKSLLEVKEQLDVLMDNQQKLGGGVDGVSNLQQPGAATKLPEHVMATESRQNTSWHMKVVYGTVQGGKHTLIASWCCISAG